MNRKILIVGIFIAGFLVGAAALAAMQLFPPGTAVLAQTGGAGNAGEKVMVIQVQEVVNGESFGGEVRVTYEDAAELPDEPAALSGLFVDRDGDSFTIGTGPVAVEVAVEVVNDEEPVTTIHANYQGAEADFVITPATLIYEDTTEQPPITPEDIAAGEMTIISTVAPGSLDEIGENMELRIWGTEQNGQLVADVLLYAPIR